ncbi:hypothetical protein [Pseudomonas coronafaciens]|uniref:hypothetical protein n=1 Tax=Pseudomonas coronafaciens TaxID=53409 RepID=UPI001F2E2D10|nr:hypothetical protein [Pseudomonas coronafaciens]
MNEPNMPAARITEAAAADKTHQPHFPKPTLSLDVVKDQHVDFMAGTDALQVIGNGYNHPILVRIDFEIQADDSVILTSRGGHTGTVIRSAKSVHVLPEEWKNLQSNLTDDLAMARWAFSKNGWVLRDDE